MNNLIIILSDRNAGFYFVMLVGICLMSIRGIIATIMDGIALIKYEGAIIEYENIDEDEENE